MGTWIGSGNKEKVDYANFPSLCFAYLMCVFSQHVGRSHHVEPLSPAANVKSLYALSQLPQLAAMLLSQLTKLKQG